jgi:signal transduction histidine kinase
MVRLVDDLLDVSRITRGKLQFRRERVELASVVQSAVEGSRPLIESNRHDLTIHLPAEPVLIRCFDPARSEADDQNPVSLGYDVGGLWVGSFHGFVSFLK